MLYTLMMKTAIFSKCSIVPEKSHQVKSQNKSGQASALS